MARLPYLDKHDLPEDQQDLLKRPINLNRMTVHTLGGARAFGAFGHFIRWDSKLDARLRELAILQVGWLARSPYEWSHHVKIGMDFGVSERDIDDLIADTDGKPNGFDTKTRAVLALAREMTRNITVPDAIFDAVRGYFDEEVTVELVMAISHYSCIVRFLAALQIDVEPEYQPYLDKFPLPG